jgi:hypothetical protein
MARSAVVKRMRMPLLCVCGDGIGMEWLCVHIVPCYNLQYHLSAMTYCLCRLHGNNLWRQERVLLCYITRTRRALVRNYARACQRLRA